MEHLPPLNGHAKIKSNKNAHRTSKHPCHGRDVSVSARLASCARTSCTNIVVGGSRHEFIIRIPSSSFGELLPNSRGPFQNGHHLAKNVGRSPGTCPKVQTPRRVSRKRSPTTRRTLGCVNTNGFGDRGCLRFSSARKIFLDQSPRSLLTPVSLFPSPNS